MVYSVIENKEFIMSNIREEAIILFREIRLSFWKSEITEQQYIEKTRDMLVSFLPEPTLARVAAEKAVAINLQHLPKIENPQEATAHQKTMMYAMHERQSMRLICAAQKAALDHFLEGGVA